MKYGFQVAMSNGVQTIGESGLTYSLVDRQTITLSGGYNYNWSGKWYVASMFNRVGRITNTNFLGYSNSVYAFRNSGFAGRALNSLYQNIGSGATNCQIFRFGRAASQFDKKYGIEIFSEDALKTFDSDWQFLKILAIQDFPLGFTGTWSYTAPIGTEVAIAVSGGSSWGSCYSQDISGWYGHVSGVYMTAFRAINNVASISSLKFSESQFVDAAVSGGSDLTTSWNRSSYTTMKVMVVDVTGLI